MKNLLIGITGSANSGKREVTAALCEELHLRRFNLLQPVIDACAAATGLEGYDLYRAAASAEVIPFNTTANQLIKTVRNAFLFADQASLIRALELRMSASQHLSHLFGGTIIDGITGENEADWLRRQGGLLVHLHNTDQADHKGLICVNDEDYLCALPGRTTIIQFTIPHLADALRKFIKAKKG